METRLEDYILDYYEVYIRGAGEGNAHDIFARRLGMDKESAKRLAYKLAYSLTISDIERAVLKGGG